jgi:putative methyltransferase (TIGR04325 family)
MAKVKDLLKTLIPPIIISAFRLFKKPTKTQEMWSGEYTSWSDAQIRCTGYDSEVILEKCMSALLKVKKGEARYERDSVLFDEIQYSWGLLVGLQKAAIENDGKLCVLDFGGSLGSSYFQNKDFLNSLKELQWCIVEQPHFVECGKKYFEDDKLRFYGTIEACLIKHRPNVLLLSGVLQYLEKPYEWIEKFIGLGITYIIIDRASFVEGEKEMLTVQNVPESIYPASYPAWFFNYKHFVQQLIKSYDLILDFENGFTSRSVVMGKICSWRGIILKKSK